MTKEEFKKGNPHLEEYSNLTEETIGVFLVRFGGLLEGLEGFAGMSEVGKFIHAPSLRALQVMLRLVFTLQCRVLEHRAEIEKYKKFQNENNEMHLLLGAAVEEIASLKEALAQKEKKK